MFVAVTYCNILVLVVTDTYHSIRNICGERLLRQYKYFVAKELFQQNQNWWHEVVISTVCLFMAKSYCHNTYIPWGKSYFNKPRFGSAK
jgi:hypothetical protein